MKIEIRAGKCCIYISRVGHCHQLSGLTGAGCRYGWCCVYFFHDYCVSFEYDYGGFAFGVECHYAEYDGWPGAVYAGMSGAFSHADLHGGRLSAL